MAYHETVELITTTCAVDALLDAYVLGYTRHQRDAHHLPSIDFDPLKSPGNIAHLKHAWQEDLVDTGRVKPSDLLALVAESQTLNCLFVEKVLPSILGRLTRTGQLRKNIDDTYSAVY